MILEEKNKLAVALRYNKKDKAPIVIAKGKGIVAQNIIQKGLDENISIYEDTKAVKDIYNVELGAEVPQELYETVASILAFVYRLDKEKGECIE